jgi:hypothetical protein
MPAERPGDNYYEHQFGDRIRGISKGGSPPKPERSGNGKGVKTAGGIGGFIVMVIVIGALRGWNSSRSYNNYNNYTTPPQVQFQPPPAIQWQPPPAMPVGPLDFNQPEIQINDQEALRRLLEQNQRAPDPAKPVKPPAAQEPEAKGSPLLTPEDVAHLPSFCFRLHKKGTTTDLTPDRRVFDRLDADGGKLLAEIAANTNEEPAPQKRDEMLEALNRILDAPDFFDANYFRDVEIADDLKARLAEWTEQEAKTLPQARRINRALFEASFPKQIVPRSAQPLSDEKRRDYAAGARFEEAWLRRR